MQAQRALELVQPHLPRGVRAEVDDGFLLLFLRRDMLHLDADALADRLAHWSARELEHASPKATASLSFRHARPADPHEASTLDLQEGWLDLEPTLAMDLDHASESDVLRLAALTPHLVELTEKEGRPAGFRSPDVGSIE